MTARTSHQFPAFLAAGGIAAAANVGSRIVFNRWLAYVAAIVLAYIVGMIVAFVLNRLFVFKTTVNPLHHQVLWFSAVNVAALLQTLAISLLLAHWLFPALGVQRHVETASHIIGVMVPAVTSYIGHRYLTFRQR